MKKIISIILCCSSWSVLAMDPVLRQVFQKRSHDIPCKLSFSAYIDNKSTRYCVFLNLLRGNKEHLEASAIVDLARNLLKDKPADKDSISGVFYSMENLAKIEKNYLVFKITVMSDSLVLIKRYIAQF